MNDNVLWERPLGCICGHEVVEDSGKLYIMRVQNEHCPVHGSMVQILDYLESVISDYLKSIPGGNRISPAMARRILETLVPKLLEDDILDTLVKAREQQLPVQPPVVNNGNTKPPKEV